MSIPAATPDDVQRFPSTTQRAEGTHVTFRPWLEAQLKDCLFEVAR